MVAFSAEMQANDRALKDFLFENMYRHYKLNRMTSKARRLVKDLFPLACPRTRMPCPPNGADRAGAPNSVETARTLSLTMWRA